MRASKAIRLLEMKGSSVLCTPRRAAIDDPLVEGHGGVICDFVEAVTTGTEPLTAGSDNIASLAMVFAAIESATTGQRCRLDLV